MKQPVIQINRKALDILCSDPSLWTSEQVNYLKIKSRYLFRLATSIQSRLSNLAGYQRLNERKTEFAKQSTEQLQSWRKRFNHHLRSEAKEHGTYFLYEYIIGSDEYIVDQTLRDRGERLEIPFKEHGLWY